MALAASPACLAQAPNPVSGALGLAPGRARPDHGPDSLEDRNDGVLVGNPLLDGFNPDRLSWFATAEIDLLYPHVTNQLLAPVAVGGRVDSVSLPAAKLNATAAPRFELGYRFGQAAGEFLVAYRFVSSDGSANYVDPTGNVGPLRSRFSMNVIDLDYASHENSLLPKWEMRWRVGARVAGLYFDSEATTPALSRHVVNNFWGGGPHASLELWRPFLDRKFSFLCRVDAAGVFGNCQDTFTESIAGANGVTRQSQFMPTTMLNVQAGLAWTPTDAIRVSAGYTYENWWDAVFTGGFNPATASRGDVWTQGLFFRGEWRY
jgi:hypothetical protein